MSNAGVLALALLLDAVLGEPRAVWTRLAHPAVLIGRAVAWGDSRFNRGRGRRVRGIAFLALLATGAAGLGVVAEALLPAVLEAVAAAVLLAQKSLAQHVRDVARALRLSRDDGRRAVARIVGRDTGAMDSSAVARASIESAAENLSDGVVAPAFWFLVLGLPGLLVYKAVNTADSMIGYRTPRHRDFGMAAARTDDLLSWVPARLTAVLIAAAHGNGSAFALARREAGLHRSPNAGWPEAAMAGVLGIALSGPRSYDGQMTDDPWVNPLGRRTAGPADIDAAVATLWRVWAIFLIGSLTLSLAL